MSFQLMHTDWIFEGVATHDVKVVGDVLGEGWGSVSGNAAQSNTDQGSSRAKGVSCSSVATGSL